MQRGMAEGSGRLECAAPRVRPSPRTGLLGIAAIVAVALVSHPIPQRPLLVWNASPSSPRGLYLVVAGARYRTGETIVAWPSPAVAALAAARGYLPRGVPLVKTVAAVPGDRVCAAADRITIDSRIVVYRRAFDSAGRRLPGWRGCRTLGRGQVLLLGLSHPASFDGRYFGASEVSQVLGEARLVWTA